MKNFAVVLSGCGQHDGSETHETILTLLALDKAFINWQGFAPDITNSHIINHVTDTEISGSSRSVLQESARLVRGKIKPLSELHAADFDAIIFPGGMGAVKVLCNWYFDKQNFTVDSEVTRVFAEIKQLQKPHGLMCIAPMLLTKFYTNAKYTIGNDSTLAAEINATGSEHIDCDAANIVIDSANKLVTTPANMVAKTIHEVAKGIEKLVAALLEISG